MTCTTPLGLEEGTGKGGSCPYQDLHVYMVEGVVEREEEAELGNAFLGNWVEERWSFLFFSAPSEAKVLGLPRMGSDLKLLDTYAFTYDQWQGGGIGPSRIGHFLIVPPWLSIEAAPWEQRIVLDPGVVFGNGLHPTTRDCLSALSMARDYGAFEEVLDLGTGTGILAVAAAVLGARRVTAVDINPLCIKTARKNVQLNDLDGIVKVMEGRADECPLTDADLVMANLPHQAVAGVLDRLGDRSRKRPRCILSGLMRSEARDIRERIRGCGLRLEREWDHEMTWYTLLVTDAKEDASPGCTGKA